MSILKKSLRFLLAAMLIAAFALSVTACHKGTTKDDKDPGTIVNPNDPADPTDPTNPTDPTDPTDPAKQYTVEFNSMGGSAVNAQTVTGGSKLAKPAAPELASSMFAGWYTDEGYTKEYNFNTAVNAGFTLYAKWVTLDAAIKTVKGYNESLAVEWQGDASSSTVKYKSASATEWTTVDAPLVRAMGGGITRVDVVGLAEGEYNVKIDGSSSIELPAPIAVTAYDRSGYAHFKYTDGVGAYKDDGTIKDNALVIYVTDENKNTVKTGYLNGAEVDLSQYLYQNNAGIGWLLNNRAYSGQINNYGITKLCNTYGAVAVRFIGTVNAEKDETKEGAQYSLINGLTAYDSEENGGTEGDNGRMARMISAKNITLEGIGEEATIYGWGFHLVNNDVNYKTTKAGSNFEVRNLTFNHYPEDAIGMEGNVQEPLTDYTKAPVERCWVHNNVFLSGFCGNPTESDKAEGDGSCDFKRGEYFTLSYNYFTDCHKTNLIGASTKNFQYNVTFHHNWWNNCGSRVPYVRNANVHFYNNYVTTADDGENDYVHDMDGTSYLFSESNYYFNCKQITRPSTGDGKAWQNTYYACWSYNDLVEAETRDQHVSSKCSHKKTGVSLENFDTNPDLFYYNATTKQSDCILDDSVTARLNVMKYAGVNNWGKNNPKKDSSMPFKQNPIRNIPTSAVPVPDEGELAIKMPDTKNDTTVSGVLFSGLTGIPEKGVSVKGKGQIISFILATEAEVSFSASAGDPDYLAEIIDSNAVVYARKVNSANLILPAGTYSISSGTGTRTGSNAKEVTISNLTFKSTAGAAQARIDNLNAAIDALPETVTVASGSLINAAKTAANVLKADELTAYKADNATRWAKYEKALKDYSNAQIADVIAKIDAIGTVGENSYPAISAARDAYDALSATQRESVTNYSALTAAQAAWENVAVSAVNNSIASLTDVSAWTAAQGKQTITDKKSEYETVKSAYENLTAEQQSGVTNYAKVTSGIEKLDALLAEIAQAEQEAANLASFTARLEEVTDASALSLTQCNEIVNLYNGLSEADKATYADNETYKAVVARQTELASQVIVALFVKDQPELATDAGFTVSGKYNSNGSFEYNGTTYAAPLKLESSTSVTFTTATAKKITIKLGNAGGQLNVDGTKYEDTDNDGFIVIDNLAAGSHSITKASGDPNLCYVILEAAE